MTADGSPGDGTDGGGGSVPENGADTDGGGESVPGNGADTGSLAGRATTALEPLVASKLRIAVLVLVGLIGLAAAAFFLGVLGVPEVAGIENDFGNVTENETVIETNVTVRNPNPVGVSLGGVTADYTVRMNDVGMANGTKEGISIESGNSTMRLETVMYNDRIPPWWASHVSNRERTDVQIDATVTSSTLGRSRTFTREREIETDILGQFASQEERPIDGNLPVVDDPLLVVTETDASWGTVTREETPLNMDFTVFNPNTEPYAISELRYEITMNDFPVARGATEDPFVIPGRTTNTLHATTNIQNQRLDEWWVSHLNESVYDHQVTLFRIEFTAVVELPGGEEVTVPLDDLTYREWIGTDVLGEGGDVGEPPEEMPEDDGGVLGGDGDWGDGDWSDDGNDSDADGSSDGSDGGNETDGGDGSDDGGLIGGGGDGSDGNDSDDGGILGARVAGVPVAHVG
jgi:LEA14-like dessication related protein